MSNNNNQFPAPHPFIALRRAIRQSGKQYRQANDNSESLFHPTGGFTYAYDIGQVEAALDEYQKSLPTELQDEENTLTMEEQIMRQGNLICNSHPSMDARDFARLVLGYFAMENLDNEIKLNPLRLINTSDDVQDSED